MSSKLYEYMNWPDIEGLVYSECSNPYSLLGASMTKDGMLVQAFRPEAVEINVSVEGKKKKYPMEKIDEAGYFACLIPAKKIEKYKLIVEDIKGKTSEFVDPYSLRGQLDKDWLKKFKAGNAYDAYDYLGSHEMTIDGVSGVYFTVWAPNARRVSIIGDFNKNDGRVLQMNLDKESGVFELFVPGLSSGDAYLFEVRLKDGSIAKKLDPYAKACVELDQLYSVADAKSSFEYSDKAFLDKRTSAADSHKEPMSVLELNRESFRDEALVKKVKDMGFNYVELTNLFMAELDRIDQNMTNFAMCEEFDLDEIKSLINDFHKTGIGVIVDCNIAYLSQGMYSLVYFDGSHLYDKSQVSLYNHEALNVATFDYRKPQVRSYLNSSIIYCLKELHADGLKFPEVASMLYLDYGRVGGQWETNIYGGNENLEAIDYIKSLKKTIKKAGFETILIAEESSAFGGVCGEPADDCLGFDYKWNDGFKKDFVEFYRTDPLFRKGYYKNLTNPMLYQYRESFFVGFSKNGYGHYFGNLAEMSPSGDGLAHAKSALDFIYAYPGKKLVNIEETKGLEDHVRMLNDILKSHEELYLLDEDQDGFDWVDDESVDETLIAFARKSQDKEMTVVVNFTPVKRTGFKLGVMKAGKYRDIFTGKEYLSYDEASKGCPETIEIDIDQLGSLYLEYTEYTPIEKEEIKIKKAAKKALDDAMKEVYISLKREEEAELRAKAAKEAEAIALEAAATALEASKEARKKARDAQKECERIKKDMESKLDALHKGK